MKRAMILLLIGCGVGLLSLVVSQANALKRSREVKAVAVASAPISPPLPQQANPIAPAVLAVAGLPVTLTTGTAANSKGFSELPSRINLTSIADITSANLVMFEVDRTGKVQGIESWTRTFEPSAVKTDQRTGARVVDFDLRVRRRVNGQHPLLLALESVSSSNQTWQADSATLLQAALTKASGKPEILLPIQQKTDPRAADYGMNHCARAFAIAVAFSKYSDNAGGLPGFSCDQQTRDFVITFGTAKAALAQ